MDSWRFCRNRKCLRNLTSSSLSSYSNLITLLAEGFDYINNAGGGTIILISNSDMVGDRDLANQLIDDLKRILNPNTILHVSDFAVKNVKQYKIGDRNYFGNEYFYYNITKITGGNFYQIKSYNYLFTKSDVNSISKLLTARLTDLICTQLLPMDFATPDIF